MSEIKKGNNFIQNVDKFFRRVQNQDLITLGGKGKINFANSPQSKEELKLKQQMQVFRQYLQNKNWNLKHIEFFDEYRRMDSTFPIINAALRLYSQEVCLTGDCIVSTPSGEKTIKELYDEKKSLFFVDSFHPHFNIAINSECRGVVSNGIKDVYEVTVVRNIDEITAQSDTKTVAKFKCTDNHKIMLPDKSFKELKDLKIGDTIFAKYISVDPSCSCKKQNFVTTIITDIKHVGQEEVFDLLNVTPHHNFSLKLTDSFYIYVHNCNKDADGDIFKIISDDKSIKKSLNECFYDNLKLDSKSYLYVRSMLKFGNLFGFLETRRGVGVTDIINLPPESIRIMLLQQADRLDQFNYIWNGYGGGIEFDPWEIVHWKIIEDIEHEPYGQSILRSIVDTWRRIVLMREALIIYRITRAPQRFLFKIDTTGLDGDAALRFAEQMKKQLTKKPLVNPITGEIDAKFTTASVLEDFYMPTQDGDVGDVRILEGATNLDQVEDYKIIKDDLFAGLLIPKSYLSFEEDLCMTGDTNIPTLSGVDKSMEVLAEDYKNGIKNYVYASDEQGNIVPGEVVWAGQTKEVDEIYEVTLDNDEVVKCTGNHPFRLRNGEYKNAEDLIEGESLMPFYTKVNESGYENIFHNDKAKWEATHQMVAKYRNSNCYKQERQGKKVVHHKDFNKRNNNPENLQECTQKEHIQYHKEIAYKNLCSEKSRQKAQAKRETKEYKENLSNIRKKYFLENEKASEVISLTNKKLKKTSLMLKKHKELVAVKEVSQFGKNNGNYKGMITYEELLTIKNLGVNGFGDFKEKIKNLFPSKAVNFNIQTYANAFNFSKKEFCEFLGFKYVNSSKRVFMIDEKTFIERIKKGEVYNSIIKDMGYSSTVVDNYFQHKYGKSFFNYQEENLENIYFNHKVKSVKRVKLDTPIKVYDITVDKYHNFALSAGVFVHNCLRSSELVLTNEGKVTIEDLANIFSETPDKKIYTLSCSEFGLITHGKINWCRATKKVETLYRIHLSNGRYNDVTDNHPFLLESMIYKRADELKVGDVIKNIYEKEISVVNIEFLELEDSEYVYDLEVEKYHNFALDSGIFVHNSNKAALSQEDLRFNNAVKQYQSYYIDGMMHVALVHLYMNGYSKDELESFELQMNGSSTLAEKAKNELLQQRIDLANSALTQTIDGISLMSFTNVLKDILKFTDEEIAETFKNQMIENKLIWQLKQLRDEGYAEDPDPNKKKARMKGMIDQLDVFKDLQFEASEQLPKVGEIISRKLDKEIKSLVGGNKKKPSKKMIESVVNLHESKVKKNIKKTYTDLGMKPEDGE